MQNLDRQMPVVLSVFRVVMGLSLLLHGTSKLFGWPMASVVPLGSWPHWYAGIIEVVAGGLIAIGLFTRPTAFIASGTMAVAYFWVHFPSGFWPIVNKGEPAVLLCFAFLLLVFSGPGAIAVEARIRRKPARVTG
ncbi:DoxX family protein [Mycobacterium syngnathidarum]